MHNVRTIEETEKLCTYHLFKTIISQKEPFTAPIPKQNLTFFKGSQMEACSKTNKAAIKEEKDKSTHILLAANSGREIKSFLFAHESSSFPPSLTSKGKMHHGEKKRNS